MARDTRRGGMIITAVQVLRERGGADGLTVEEVLLRSGAPKGSVYYHFPGGGRTELLDEALTYAGNTVSALLNRAATDGPESVLQEFIDIWRHVLTDSGYTAGCPVVAVAVSRTESEELADKARGSSTSGHRADERVPGRRHERVDGAPTRDAVDRHDRGRGRVVPRSPQHHSTGGRPGSASDADQLPPVRPRQLHPRAVMDRYGKYHNREAST